MVGMSVNNAVNFGISPQMAALFGLRVGAQQQALMGPGRYGRRGSYQFDPVWAAQNNAPYLGPPVQTPQQAAPTPAPQVNNTSGRGSMPPTRRNLPEGTQVRVFADGSVFNPSQSIPSAGSKLAPTYGEQYSTRYGYLNGGIQGGYSAGLDAKKFNSQLRLQDSLQQQGVFSNLGTASTLFRLGNSKAISSGINTLAGKAMPTVFNPGVPLPAGVHGPVQPAGLIGGTGTTLSGAIGGAGIGYTIGNIYSGLTGAKPVGSSVGGTIGGIAGSFLPIPGGTIIGSVVGSAIGGLFGGSNPTSASESVTVIGSKGQYIDGGIGTKRAGAEYAAGVQGELVKFTASLGDLGVAFQDGKRIRAGYNKNQGGGFVSYEGTPTATSMGQITNRMTFDINDQQAASNNLAKAAVGAININAIEDKKLREGLQSYTVGNKTMGEVYDDIRNMLAPTTNKNGDLLKPRALDEKAKDRIKIKTATAKQQMDDFLKGVKEETVGKKELIKTSPLGILEDVKGIKRKLSSGIPLGSFDLEAETTGNVLGV